ncbi:maleylacetoacetate isomerase [Duganella sp. FT50W]|uniref:Maleylacetoacetate isomerase n=1 Tax=Duganella lactea TaxID=2692173 RepID=A0A6L8MH93_9BURK|nr:maleylacetoacetate isomerase [Duganella lactea]MYM81884.1 maleylacetoacetate isomerase [Duganella lactea]
MAERVLHNYFRSSSAYRVRIALNLKGLAYEYVPVHLNRNGGEQFGAPFVALNPQRLVPVLSEQGVNLSQSLAIMEYLEEQYPLPALLPASPADRAYVRQLSLAMACDIHPLNNLRVLKYISGAMGQSDEARQAWIAHWTKAGLDALEQELARAPQRGRFCFGDTPTMADCCLVPQLFNAQRFNIDLAPYPTLRAIDAECQKLAAFAQAHPAHQPDAE